jgi:magnesium transporter
VVTDLAELGAMIEKWPVTWIHVDGLGKADTLHALAERFGLHPLALEDVVNVHQRAKTELYGEELFIVARLAELHEHLDHEQISMFIGPRFVLTFQERSGDCFDPVRERLRSDRPRIRGSGPDYLAYALLDAIIDSYFPILESFGERLALLEERVIEEPDSDLVAEIRAIGRDLLLLRKLTWPHRDAFNHLMREETPLVQDETRLFLRDCYDHTIQLMDLIENYREVGSGLMDLYLSSISKRMNDVMKVLTIIATIFIPLSFVAGLYGMNFDPGRSPWNMPELGWYWGYPFALGTMSAVALAMLVFFWRKGWLG